MRYLNFCPELFVIKKNGLIRKLWLIPKFMTSQDWRTNNYNTHITQFSRSKGNQTIKFGQLIELS